VELTRPVVVLPHLPRSLDGLRILHLADTHLSAGSQSADILPALLVAEPFDLAVWTGDIAEDAAGRSVLARLLRALRPRLAAYAVLGNHDHLHYRHAEGVAPHRNDLRPLVQTLEDGDVRVLNNESVSLDSGAGTLHVAGVDDPSLGYDRADEALAAIPGGSASVLLAHSPDVLLRLGPHRPGVVLAGHTHGGQLRLPGIGPLGSVMRLPRRYAMGAYRYRGVQAYVSRGVGTSGAAVRLFCPPEVALVTLRSPAAAG
jgi:predicted MPP superfamily phosphohydrolase